MLEGKNTLQGSRFILFIFWPTKSLWWNELRLSNKIIGRILDRAKLVEPSWCRGSHLALESGKHRVETYLNHIDFDFSGKAL